MSSLTQHPRTLKFNKMLWVQIPAMVITPMITYTLAVSNHQEQPFPHPSVTQTACFYPQNILFRFVMLIASSMFALSFFAIFKWLNYQADRIQIPTERPTFLYWPCQLNLLPYTITIATIDGNGVGRLHAPCAIIFFTTFLVFTVLITYIIYRLKSWDSSVISQASWRWKLFTCIELSIAWVICLTMFAIRMANPKSGDPADWLMAMEWNTVFVNVLWLFSFNDEFKRAYLCVVGKKARQKPKQLIDGNSL